MNQELSNGVGFHAKAPAEAITILESREDGLSKEEVLQRIEKYGLNLFKEKKEDSLLKIFLRQFQSPLIYVLLLASVVVYFVGDFVDSSIILFVLLVNAMVGLFEESKARNTLRSLKTLSKGETVVIRDGREERIADTDIVPGDIIIVRSGDKVPADARIISCESFKVDESTLTGESEPVEKNTEVLAEKVELPDRINMIHKGTLAVSGMARAIVVSTGSNTFFGKVAEKLSLIDTEMPLKEKIRDLSKLIGIFTFIAVIVIFYVGILRGLPMGEIFFTSVAIAVSLIPEGLPVVITLVLARGVFRMAKRNALVKNMQAVEALGQASVIAVDKTGTITKNELAVLKLYIDEVDYSITGSGYEPKGDVILIDKPIEIANHPDILFAGKIAALSADASIAIEDGGKTQISGDPTEAALLVFGDKVGFRKDEILAEEPIVFEEPFSYKHRFRVTLHKNSNGYMAVVVGEPESILSRISKVWTKDGTRDIGSGDYKNIEEKIELFGAEGLRVIMFAVLETESSVFDIETMSNLSFVGLFAMADVLREGVAVAVDKARESGIEVVMITGDHLGTARAIAEKARIWKEGDRVMSGTALASVAKDRLDESLDKVSVFGRVLPEHKLAIVEAYKSSGHTIGMTGDGVNDALSLRAAHLGLAMGDGGTEVAKEASDIILLDNNFNTIIAAIEEGRSIYLTIKKVVLYLISTSLGEFLTILGAIAIGLALPIYPSQILWLNLVTDGFLVVALAFEPNISLQNTHRTNSVLFDRRSALRAGIMGLVMMIGTLFVFINAYKEGDQAASTLSLTVLAMFQWFNVWNCRSYKDSAFKRVTSNPYIFLALTCAILLHIFAIYNSFMNGILKTVPLSLSEWITLIIVSSSILWVEEIRKFIERFAFKKR